MAFLNFINKSENKSLNQIQPEVEKHLLKVLKMLKFKKNLEMNLILVKPNEIKKLNSKYRHQNVITDVLSFTSEIPVKKSQIIADIIICPQKAEKNAEKLGHNLKKEIILLTIHGLVHITGQNHGKRSEKLRWDKIFQKIENSIKLN